MPILYTQLHITLFRCMSVKETVCSVGIEGRQDVIPVLYAKYMLIMKFRSQEKQCVHSLWTFYCRISSWDCDCIEHLQLRHKNVTKHFCVAKKYCAQWQLNWSRCLTHDLCAKFSGFTQHDNCAIVTVNLISSSFSFLSSLYNRSLFCHTDTEDNRDNRERFTADLWLWHHLQVFCSHSGGTCAHCWFASSLEWRAVLSDIRSAGGAAGEGLWKWRWDQQTTGQDVRGEYNGTPSLMRTPLTPNNPGARTLGEDDV